MQPFYSWYLLFPVMLSVLFGLTQYRSVSAMGAPASMARSNGFTSALSGAVLTVGWSVVGFPLPLFYVLAYLFRALRLLSGKTVTRKAWFLLNLGFVNTMALHLALIGSVALLRGVTMHALLASGLWRIISTAVVLTADFMESRIFLRWPRLPSVLSAEAESEEARPFMAFLWFCTGYLLMDSFMCVVELEPPYPALFLIGSIAVLMYFVIRFLLHINTIIRDEHLKDEHGRLSAQLEAAQESAGVLKRMVDRDALTGAYSRRHIMDHVSALIDAEMPFCLAFMDLDGLKRVNDSEGHDGGDRYLIGFVQAVEVRIREGDLLARVGGDEFVVLMPGCDIFTAARRIEGIRGVLETRDRGGTIFRFSYGVTGSLSGVGRDAEAVLQAADKAMYRDKEQRR